MIEALMLCGIGLLAGCLLILLFFPPCNQRAVRSTRRDLVDRGPAHGQGRTRLRAQFASSLRRLELNLVQMWQKATDRAADRQNAEVARLQVSSTKRTH